MDVAACQRQVPLLQLPPIEILEAAGFAEMAAAETRASPINLRNVIERRGYSLLGLARASETDLTLADARLSRLGGYFDGMKVVLLVNGWNTEAEKTKLLLHELVHALQAADRALISQSQSFDEFLAGRAIVEGEASFIADRAVVEAQGVRASRIDWPFLYARRLSSGAGTNILAEAYGQFTYNYGAYFLSRLDEGERRAIWQDLPTTTRELMRRPRPESPAAIGQVPSPVFPATFKRVKVANLGQWIWQSRWRDLQPPFICRELLPDIVDDTFSIFHDEASGEIVSAWRARVAPEQRQKLSTAHMNLKACYERRPDVIVGADESDLWLIVTSRPDRAPLVQGWQDPVEGVDAGHSDAQSNAPDTTAAPVADAGADSGAPDMTTLDANVD